MWLSNLAKVTHPRVEAPTAGCRSLAVSLRPGAATTESPPVTLGAPQGRLAPALLSFHFWTPASQAMPTPRPVPWGLLPSQDSPSPGGAGGWTWMRKTKGSGGLGSPGPDGEQEAQDARKPAPRALPAPLPGLSGGTKSRQSLGITFPGDRWPGRDQICEALCHHPDHSAGTGSAPRPFLCPGCHSHLSSKWAANTAPHHSERLLLVVWAGLPLPSSVALGACWTVPEPHGPL